MLDERIASTPTLCWFRARAKLCCAPALPTPTPSPPPTCLLILPLPGLAFALRCRAVGGRSPEQQAEALESLRKEVEGLGRAIGEGHMLVQGASRYYTALSKMSR